MIRNATKKTLLIKEHHVYSSLLAKALGLMFRFRAPKWAVVFPFSPPSKASIHMFFVFFSLDIVWLDKDFRVLEARTLRPWSVYSPIDKASWVLELPMGTIKKTNTKKGDLIEVK